MSTLSFEPQRKFLEDLVTEKGHRNVRAFLVPDRAREVCVQYDGNHEITVELEPAMDLERVATELMMRPRILS